ncbi:MAG: phage major capsid protein [Rickettsiales bacterium]|jgi:hypothetical protein|nr:phage major capsid protein [Rickettsiales bacterium]
MADGNLNFDTMKATTIDEYSRYLDDNVSINNELGKDLKARGNLRPDRGGLRILESLSYAFAGDKDGFAFRFTGSAEIPLPNKKFATAAEFERKMIASPIVFTDSERLANSGVAQMIDEIQAKVENAAVLIQNTLANDEYSAGAITDQIGGLQLLVQDTLSGAVGGINQQSNPWWRNSTQSGALAIENIGGFMTNMYLATKCNAETITNIYGDNTTWTYYYQSLADLQRFTNTDGKGGFTPNSVAFMGNIPVKLDGGIGGCCPVGHMYGLNLGKIFLRENKDWKGKRGLQKAINQAVEVDMFRWAGTMTTSGRRYHGVIFNS